MFFTGQAKRKTKYLYISIRKEVVRIFVYWYHPLNVFREVGKVGVEEIQKINALARELMRHGIAGTSDEALLRAEDMLKSNSVDSMTAAISRAPAKAGNGYSNEVLSEINMDVRSLGVRFEAMARELLSLREDVKRLGGGLADVSRQVGSLSSRPAAAVQEVRSEAPQPAVSVAAPASAQIRPAAAPEQPRMVNVRTGKEEFKSEDVAIEKIFYFGK